MRFKYEGWHEKLGCDGSYEWSSTRTVRRRVEDPRFAAAYADAGSAVERPILEQTSTEPYMARGCYVDIESLEELVGFVDNGDLRISWNANKDDPLRYVIEGVFGDYA